MALGFNSGHSSLPPPCTFLFELVIVAAVVGFTRPGSLARPAALLFVATCVYAIVFTANMHMCPSWALSLGGYSFSFLLRYIDLALLSQWSFEHHGPPEKRLMSLHRRISGLLRQARRHLMHLKMREQQHQSNGLARMTHTGNGCVSAGAACGLIVI